MNQQEKTEKIRAGREFMKGSWKDESLPTDQQLRKPQPPLVKAPMGGETTALPRDFEALDLHDSLLTILLHRKSSRIYTEEPVTLPELSFLLWAQQGIRDIRGKSYATLRPVACGGARHEFELYLAVMNVQGVTPGLYHYLPMTHEIEALPAPEGFADVAGEALAGQAWCAKAAVVFFYSMVAYRAEWRYSVHSHRVALIDAGHITQNLYVACSALKLGTCAIAALETGECDALFRLDGGEEFIFYAATMGRITPDDKDKEDAFYAFLEDGQ